MSETKPEFAERSPTAAPVRSALENVRRPRGLYIVPPLAILGGAILAVHHLRVFDQALTSETDPTSFSPAYLYNALGESLLALTAIVGGLTLFFGAKMGWWLTALYFPWAWARAVAVPLSMSAGTFTSEDWAIAAIRTLFLSILFLYLFRQTVLRFTGLDWLPRAWTGVALAASGCAAAYLLDPFAGPFSFSNDVPPWP